MKKLIVSVLLLSLIFVCGCGREYGILDYQSKDISAECIVNKKYRVVIEKAEEKTKLTVKEPKEAMGISFEIGSEEIYAISGEAKIKMDKENLKGICALGSIFSQSEECLISATESGKESIFTFVENECSYQLTIGENSIPKNVKITSKSFEYDVEICSVRLS